MARRPPTAPQCPYCGDIFADQDLRVWWDMYHLDSRIHRWWWKIKKIFRKGHDQ